MTEDEIADLYGYPKKLIDTEKSSVNVSKRLPEQSILNSLIKDENGFLEIPKMTDLITDTLAAKYNQLIIDNGLNPDEYEPVIHHGYNDEIFESNKFIVTISFRRIPTIQGIPINKISFND